MSRAKQNEVAALLKRWSSLRARKGRIEAERDQAIEPLRAQFERQCAPFQTRAAAKLGPVEQEIASLETRITATMMAGIGEDGHVAITRVRAATAIVEVLTHEQRELDPQRFFESVAASERSTAFWSCLKTLIGQAEKHLGKKRLDELCQAKRSYCVAIRQEQSGGGRA